MALSSVTDASNAFSRLDPVRPSPLYFPRPSPSNSFALHLHQLFHAETLASTQHIDRSSPFAIDVSDATFEWDAAPPVVEGKASKKDRKKAKKALKSGAATPALVGIEAGKAGEGEVTAQGGAIPGELDLKKAMEEGVEGLEKAEIFSLRGVEMKIPKGQLVAIVGAVG